MRLPCDWLPTLRRSAPGHWRGKPPRSAAQSVSFSSFSWTPECSEWRWCWEKTWCPRARLCGSPRGFGRPLMWSSQEWAAELRPMFTPPALDAQQQVQGNLLLCVLFHLLPIPVYILIHISLIMTLLLVLAAHMLNHPKPACFKLI